MNPISANYSLIEMLQTGIAVVIILSWLFAVLYSLWGGFLLITSWWNEEKVKPAINHIRHAVLGLIVLILILFVTPKVLDIFGLPFADELRASDIFSRMKEISSTLLGGTSNSDAVEFQDDTLPADFSDL